MLLLIHRFSKSFEEDRGIKAVVIATRKRKTLGFSVAFELSRLSVESKERYGSILAYG